MRGKGFAGSQLCFHVGITPAYAGKSSMRSIGRSPHWDHPRLCGEKIKAMTISQIYEGSPPPMRGKGLDTITVGELERITPAYAGKRSCLHDSTCSSKDHPRLCGEKLQ